MANQKF